VREIRASTMRSLLDSEVNALRVWLAEEIGDVERILRDTRVRDAIVELVRASPCAAGPRARLERELRPLLRDVGDATFNVVDRSGRLRATRFPDYCGLSVTADRFLPQLAPVFAGATRFVRPFHDRDRLAGAPRLREGPPFAWIAAPVRDATGHVFRIVGVAEDVTDHKQLEQSFLRAQRMESLGRLASGIAPLAHLRFDYPNAQAIRTLYTQLMLERGILATGAFYAMHAHKDSHVNSFHSAVNDVFGVIAEGIAQGNVESRLKGPVAHSGFKRLT
jgi:hypothetical protein